jgi:murein DD-endopeptidase MepM/ murein hydrolase activator NlpD
LWIGLAEAVPLAKEELERHRPTPAEPTLSWLPSREVPCRTYRGRRVCDGPRKAPRPQGQAALLARRLGLGTGQAANALMGYGPYRSWTDAVEGDQVDSFHWAVDGGRLGRGFGYVRRPELRAVRHDGIDIGAPAGAPIRAVADGLVAYSDNGLRNYGNVMMIIHADGAVSVYAHCRANYVTSGQHVQAGDVIGEVGATGLTRGPHLHFELRRRGRAVDPLPSFREARLALREARRARRAAGALAAVHLPHEGTRQ